jgi:hypothetical protein
VSTEWRSLGIDPGINGAASLVRGFGHLSSVEDVIDLPTIGEGSKREIDDLQLIAWIRAMAPDHAFIELVTAMPSIPGADGIRRGMGAASAFKFGFAVGQIRTAVRGCRVPITLVTPGRWKPTFALKGPDKEPSRQLALRLFPNIHDKLKRKLDHQRAEAILLATYGGRVLSS